MCAQMCAQMCAHADTKFLRSVGRSKFHPRYNVYYIKKLRVGQSEGHEHLSAHDVVPIAQWLRDWLWDRRVPGSNPGSTNSRSERGAEPVLAEPVLAEMCAHRCAHRCAQMCAQICAQRVIFEAARKSVNSSRQMMGPS